MNILLLLKNHFVLKIKLELLFFFRLIFTLMHITYSVYIPRMPWVRVALYKRDYILSMNEEEKPSKHLAFNRFLKNDLFVAWSWKRISDPVFPQDLFHSYKTYPRKSYWFYPSYLASLKLGSRCLIIQSAATYKTEGVLLLPVVIGSFFILKMNHYGIIMSQKKDT